MIRINLHPVRQMHKVQAGQRQLVLMGLLVVGELVGLGLFYGAVADTMDSKNAAIRDLEQRIESLKNEVGDFDRLTGERTRLLAQRDIINQLQKARTGPVWVLRELSDILTQGKGPTVDQAAYETLVRRDPNAAFDPQWNPTRLWIDSFIESGGQVMITGRAKDYGDVAEFNKRLSLSRYFTDDFLEKNEQIMDGTLGLKLVTFRLRCRVVY